MRNALFDDNLYKYVIRDRDYNFDKYFGKKISNIDIKEILTAYRSPWQNGYAERVIGTIRRECLDHFIVLNDVHLRKILKEYFFYYNKFRTHLGLDKDSPINRPIEPISKITANPILNGLHLYVFKRFETNLVNI
jgi:Integrase core domain